jgi:hypothetical protein
LHGEITGGVHIVSALLLPVGLFCIIAQLFFSSYNLSILLFSVQIISGSICVVIVFSINFFSTGNVFVGKKTFKKCDYYKVYYISVLVLLIVNIPSLMFDVRSACTIAKCIAIEYVVGSKSGVFSTLYLFSVVGSFFVSGIIINFLTAYLHHHE